MPDELKNALNEFVRFTQTLRGDEKSEAQTFLDHFFRALGHDGVIEAGATFEFRVAKKPGSPQLELVVAGNGDPGRALRTKGGKKFADLLWPDRVLIEMKSRGENLEKHYDQTFDYWTHIVPKRPPFVILCNFMSSGSTISTRSFSIQSIASRSTTCRRISRLSISCCRFGR